MAKIPAFAARSNLDTGNVVQYPGGSPVGQALQNAGSALGQIASHFQQKNDELDNFKLQVARQKLDLDLSGALQQSAENMPADAAGFHDGFVGQLDPVTNAPIKEGAMDDLVKKARESLPASVQDKFDAYVPLLRGEYSNRSAVIEKTGRDKFYQVETAKMLGNLETTIAQSDPNNTKAFENFRMQGEAAIKATGLSAIEKDVMLTKWRGDSAEAAWKALVASDPKTAKQALGLTPAVSSDIDDRIMGSESSGDATATNPNSTATGGGQFISSTWVRLMKEKEPALVAGKSRAQILEMRNDPNLSRRATGYYRLENTDVLKSANVPITDGNIYLAHFAGGGGATKILQAIQSGQGGQSAGAILGQAVVDANPFLKGMTASDLSAWADKKMGAPSSSGVSDRGDPMFHDISLDRRLVLANYADGQIAEHDKTNEISVAQSYADSFMVNPDRPKAYEQANAIQDVGVRQRTLSIMDSQYNRADELTKQKRTDDFQAIYKTVSDLVTKNDPVAAMNAIPASMAQEDQDALKAFIRTGRAKVDDAATEEMLVGMRLKNPTQFIKEDLNKYFGRLSIATIERLDAQQKAMVDPQTSKDLNSVINGAEDVIKQNLRGIGIDDTVSSATKSDLKYGLKIRKIVTAELEALTVKLGRPPLTSEIQEVVGQTFKAYKKDGWIWDGEGTIKDVVDEYDGAGIDIQQAVQNLLDYGNPVTTENLRKLMPYYQVKK